MPDSKDAIAQAEAKVVHAALMWAKMNRELFLVDKMWIDDSARNSSKTLAQRMQTLAMRSQSTTYVREAEATLQEAAERLEQLLVKKGDNG